MTKLTQESKDILTDWLWADYHLYKYFLERHRSMVEDFGAQRMIEAVGILRSLNSDVQKQCVVREPVSHVEKMFHPGNKRIQEIIPNTHKKWCIPFFKTEIAYTKSLRMKNRAFVKKHFKFKPRSNSYKFSNIKIVEKATINNRNKKKKIY